MALTKFDIVKNLNYEIGLNKREAKELVDSAPKAIKEGVAKAEAEEIKKSLEAAGAKVELK